MTALAGPLSVFRESAARIGALRGARGEQSLYGPFDTLLHDASTALGHPGLLFVQQVGAQQLVPDFGVFRADNVIGWVELKAPDKDLDNLRGHDQRQHRRALEDLEAFALTNGWDWRYYVDASEVSRATFQPDLLARPSDPIDPGALADLQELLDNLCTRSPALAATVAEAVFLMARRAQAVRRAVERLMQNPPPLLAGLFDEFQNLVYASGRTYRPADFADAYAQTSVFGLLLSRVTTRNPVSSQSAAQQIDRNQHPFLARCLQLFTDPALPADLRATLEEAVTTINRVPPKLFSGVGTTEPLVYAYEEFFAAYDPTERAARGVYYTPPYVVKHQVSGIQHLLRASFGASGLADRSVNYLDPATGTGTYLLGLLDAAGVELARSGAAVDAELTQLVSERVNAFELMIGPYSVAHQRVAAFLASRQARLKGRLPIYLVDTLTEALSGGLTSRFGPIGQELAEERQAAEHVKTREPVLVVFGNPPYDRIKRAALGDEWLLKLLDDVKERTPRGDRANLKALFDFYIAFWRWSAWLITERALPPNDAPQGRGILAYITNRSWLVGRGFGGLRHLISDIASELWVLDLGGDMRTSKTRLRDDNVFDVGVGVAITFAVIDRDHRGPPAVNYRRLWGSRADKEQELDRAFDRGLYQVVIREGATDPFIPVEWEELDDAPQVEDVFTQHETGIQTSRPWLIGFKPSDVLDTSSGAPSGTVGEWSQLTGPEREQAFHTTRTHPLSPRETPDINRLRRYAYRPLDYRVLYNDPSYLEWPRPRLQAAFRRPNLAMVTIERGFGIGPAAFVVDELADLHLFRGFAGARGIYPLYGEAVVGEQISLREGSRVVNLSERARRWADKVMKSWEPEDVLACALAPLNAPIYTSKFEGGLTAERPRIPLSLDLGLVAEAVALGHQLIDLWTLRAAPLDSVRWDAQGRTATTVGESTWVQGDRVAVAGRYLEGVPHDAWLFQVSGYPVLPRYLRDRATELTDASVMSDLRLVASTVTQLVNLGVPLDDLLLRLLAGPMAPP